MWRLILALFLSTLGGTVVVHYLKNFLFKGKTKLRPDGDGLIERCLITYLLVANQTFIFLIPVIVILKILFRIFSIGIFENLSQRTEPGLVWQKVRLKGELAFD